jgi:hypothetical protein
LCTPSEAHSSMALAVRSITGKAWFPDPSRHFPAAQAATETDVRDQRLVAQIRNPQRRSSASETPLMSVCPSGRIEIVCRLPAADVRTGSHHRLLGETARQQAERLCRGNGPSPFAVHTD